MFPVGLFVYIGKFNDGYKNPRIAIWKVPTLVDYFLKNSSQFGFITKVLLRDPILPNKKVEYITLLVIVTFQTY